MNRKPILLLLGGFQGSGKTTTVELIRKNIDLLIISPDEIRYQLFAKKMPFGEKFVNTVEETRNKLLKEAIKTKRDIVIDQRVTPPRILAAKEIIKNSDYQLKIVFLKTPEEVLINRVTNRAEIQGKYKGTVDELKACLQEDRKLDLSLYDFVIDSNKHSPSEVAKKIIEEVWTKAI